MTRARIILAIVVALAIVAGVLLIRRSGDRAGADRVTARIEQQHGERVSEARADERAADAVSQSISRRVSRADDLSTAAVQATIKDLRDAIDAVPPAVAGDPLPTAPVDRLRDQLDAGIARANRAADAADARP